MEGSGFTVGNSTILELLWKFLGYSVKYGIKFIYLWVLINHSYNVCSPLSDHIIQKTSRRTIINEVIFLIHGLLT